MGWSQELYLPTNANENHSEMPSLIKARYQKLGGVQKSRPNRHCWIYIYIKPYSTVKTGFSTITHGMIMTFQISLKGDSNKHKSTNVHSSQNLETVQVTPAEWINKVWIVQNGTYSAWERNEILCQVLYTDGSWNTVLHDISLAENRHYITPLTWGT